MGLANIDIHVTDFVKDVGVPVTVALLGVVGAAVTAALSFALGRSGDAASRRRDGYAAATKALVAYAEYPWKIRRRTADTPNELARLVALGHDLQENLRCHQTWVNSENRWVGRVYREVREDLGRAVGPACNEAWNMPPVTTAGGMRLGDWGPQGLDAHLERFESARAFRFGWRRLLGAVHLHLGVEARPQPRYGTEPRCPTAGRRTATPESLPLAPR